MKKLISLLLVLAMALSLAACGAKEAAPAETKAPAAAEAPAAEAPAAEAPAEEAPAADLPPIKVGNIQDTSGGASIAGQPNAWGVEYAAKWINENGGINGRMIEVYTRDCQNDAQVGVTCYRELVDEIEVDFIIGPPLSNPASAWVELATEDEVPIVGHFMDEMCTTDPDTGDVYPYMFLAEPSCAVQSYILATYAVETLGVKSVATLYNTSNAYAVAHEAPFVNYIKDNGGEVLAQETFGWSDTSYAAQAQKIAALNPDAVLLCDYCNQMVQAYDRAAKLINDARHRATLRNILLSQYKIAPEAVDSIQIVCPQGAELPDSLALKKAADFLQSRERMPKDIVPDSLIWNTFVRQ